MKASELYKRAIRLDPEERSLLAHTLLESVEADGDDEGELSEEFKRELDACLAEHDKNPEEGMLWEDFKKTLRTRKKKRTVS